MIWTDEMIDTLRTLWDERDERGNPVYSTPEIGRRLGVSKNAAIGKAHRLNLPPRRSPIIRNGVRAEPRPRIIRPHRAVSTLPALAAAAEARRVAVEADSMARLMGAKFTPDPAKVQRLTQVQFSALGRAPAKPPELTMEQLRLALIPVRDSSPHRRCQWVTNERRPYQFCGKPSTYRVCDDGETLHWYSWCLEHKRRVYVRPAALVARAA